jgi:hypothetical protein
MAQESTGRIAYLKSLRLKIQAALDGSVDKAGTASYTINDSDGSQSLTRRSPKELWDMLRAVDAEIADLERRLSGGGIRTFGTRLRP